MIEQRIKSLIDKRIIVATQKELSKKLQTIVKAFGRPIIEQVMSYSSLPDFWEIEAPEILDGTDDNIILRGYYFDGLSRGINLCIKITTYDGKMSEIQATYNGYQVFLESEGEIKSYVPSQKWEEEVDKLFLFAKPTAEEKIKVDKEKHKEENKKKAMSIMEKLRLLWGF